jgi:lysophospholipase L1-like esterase
MRRRVLPSGWVAPLVPLVALLAGLALPAAAGAQTRYIAFGDSITAGVGDDEDRAEPGYPPRLENRLNGAGQSAVVINAGVGGERTPEGLERINQVLSQGGDVLLLMEGTNDISRGIPPEATVFNLEEMAQRAERRGMEAVHATLIPRIPSATTDPDNLENQALVEQIRELAGISGRRLVDNFQRFSTFDDLFDDYYWQEPSDHVGHPNALGYDEMADTFLDVLTGVDSTPPVEGLIEPLNGARRVPRGQTILVNVWDFGAGIDLAATDLIVNGQDVGVVPQGNANRATLSYSAPDGLANVVTVGLRSRDLATPPNTVDRQIARFIVSGTQFLDGDFDESGRVDGADLFVLAFSFGSRRGQQRYSPRFDINLDLVIDGEDLALLAANFGRSSF